MGGCDMRLLVAMIVLLASHTVLAQPALYEDMVLTIPQGAVIDDGEVAYFESIQLQAVDGGGFVLVAAEERSLVSVDSLDILVMESFPLQISVAVSGHKSVPCVQLLTPAVSFKDNRFLVTLAESQLGPAESCIAVIDPFETAVALDVIGLKAGTYGVTVNGVETEFTLQSDN